MPTFGAHGFIWVGEWNSETGRTAIESAARAGVDILEIPLLRPDTFDAPLTKQQLADNGLKGVCSLGLPAWAHLPFEPQKAEDFLKLAVDKVAELGTDYLGGVLYANLGTFTEQPPTQAERDTCARVLRVIALYAKERGISLALEPVNRYETYLYNTIADVLTLIDGIGVEGVKVHADTYHMNIEESGNKRAIEKAGPRLGYIHLSESDRGVPGQGNVHWDDVFAGLAAIKYTGPLVLESFASINPDLAGATRMWRTPSYTADDLAKLGLEFLRGKAAEYGLQ